MWPQFRVFNAFHIFSFDICYSFIRCFLKLLFRLSAYSAFPLFLWKLFYQYSCTLRLFFLNLRRLHYVYAPKYSGWPLTGTERHSLMDFLHFDGLISVSSDDSKLPVCGSSDGDCTICRLETSFINANAVLVCGWIILLLQVAVIISEVQNFMPWVFFASV